jgi:hypothetical protein
VLFVAIMTTPVRADTFNDLDDFLAATGPVTLINFDTDPDGNPTSAGAQIGSTYASVGADFPLGNTFSTFGEPVSPPHGWLNNTDVGGDKIFDVEMVFDDIYAVGVHNVWYGSAPNGALLEAFDGSGGVLESVMSDGDLSTLDFFGVTTSDPISYVTVTVINPSGWGLDDLYIGIPEPASLALLGLGAALLARRRR